MLIQELWKRPCGWDNNIPEEGEDGLHARHTRWREEIKDLPQVCVPRCYLPSQFDPTATTYQRHVFTDASEKAYGAVAYLRATSQIGENSIRFVMARSRLAPKRVQTIPRLEHLAALSGAEVVELLEEEMKMKLSIICWSDSTTVLSWIKSESCRYNRFVGARIAEIQRLTDHTLWRYVDTGSNPADDLTRGLKLSDLTEESRWHAAHFLYGPEDGWPKWPDQKPHQDVELKSSAFTAHTVNNPVKAPQNRCFLSTPLGMTWLTLMVAPFTNSRTKPSRSF